MSAFIYGVGTSQFGKQPELRAEDLAASAVLEALEDAGVADVEAVLVGSVFGPPGLSQRVLHALGITRVPILTVENTCASGTSAYHEAVMGVENGRWDCVLALGLEKMTATGSGPIEPEPTDAEGRAGMALPAIYAMSATRYLACFGLTERQLAAVSVKNHRHAIGNPRAQYRAELSVEDVLGSRMIADPLTLLQCCPISDAAAAAVVGRQRGKRADVRVRASVLQSGDLWDYRSEHVWGYELTRSTGAAAFAQAGVQPQDLDVLEVHDAFTISEIVATEALGLAAEGHGAELLDSGRTALGGTQPVNPSGGLLSRGHPVGATGLGQIAEIVWQLGGRAGARQVEGARIGAVETLGGGTAGIDGNACVVSVLEVG